MSDWVKRSLEAYQVKVDERNARLAEVREEHKTILAASVSWLIGESFTANDAYVVEPNSYRLKVVHPEHTVIFTLTSDDNSIGVIHQCDKCHEEYATATRSPAELGQVLAEGKPPHPECKADTPASDPRN